MENKGLEILLVEDNMNDAELTIRALKKKNVSNNIIHLRNGAEALDFLFGKGVYANRETNNTTKLILLDLKMPKVDGLEVLKIIKTDKATQNIPVVVLTSSQESPDVKKAYALGANSYIVKPVDFNRFVEAVTEVGLYWILLNQFP